MWFVFMLIGAGGALAWDRYARDRRSPIVVGREVLDVTESAPAALPPPPPDIESPPTSVARGAVTPEVALKLGSAPERLLPSPLKGVSDGAWTRFCNAMKTQEVTDVSPSNAVGMFEMMPRRLVDLGLIHNTRRVKSKRSGRTVLVGEFVSPMTEEKFTSSALPQYNAFVMSMRDYAGRLRGKGIESPNVPGMTLSGALAVLHRCGPERFASWAASDEKFPTTKAAYDRANGIF